MNLLSGPLVLATHNKGKLLEYKELLADFDVELQSAGDLGLSEPEETGSTFEANAILKAQSAANEAGLPALADDSGFAVDALDGQPGIYSARWAGPGKDFGHAMARVEAALRERGVDDASGQRARFVCVLALVAPGDEPVLFRGEVAGVTRFPPRGGKGFGYDPIFQPDGQPRTFGEMSSEEKHGWHRGHPEPLSHRARAFAAFANQCLVPLGGTSA